MKRPPAPRLPPPALSRRSFLKTGTALAAISQFPTVLSSRVFGASERLNLGMIGIGTAVIQKIVDIEL